MYEPQEGILAGVPANAAYLFFSLKPGSEPTDALKDIAELCDGKNHVLGLGEPLLLAMDKTVPGMKSCPSISMPGNNIPSTQQALWVWLRGSDQGELLHESRRIEQMLGDDFILTANTNAFMYQDSRDLSGYIDGTENPAGEEAVKAATVSGKQDSLNGSSFVAVQQWIHDFDQFQQMTQQEQDNCFGRRASDNEEFDDAPDSAHVKRTAQESFKPEAFVVRRSMPWSDGQQAGLVFVAFGHSFDAFEAQLNRMAGKDDGIMDALFKFTRPVTGSYFWCPPMKKGKLDLSLIGF
ncbi:MAG: Dyp-type peroxidase [Gammaproteobacteria bacterium]|nr:Dyp-type peroxidase [Gammaproteobacteria bacterium]